MARRRRGLLGDPQGTAWVTHVPSARVRRPAPTAPAAAGGTVQSEGTDVAGRERTEPLQVIAGHAQFEAYWCTDRDRCTNTEDYDQRRVPCPGHGRWHAAPPVPLSRFILAVCGGQVRVISAADRLWLRESRHDGGSVLWTTRPHAAAEAEQRRAGQAYKQWAAPHRAAWERRAERAAADHARLVANAEALLQRQDALIRPTVEFVYHAAGASPRVLDGERSPRYAMGVPVLVGEKLWAVICPVATRITPGLAGWFSTATIVVADTREQARIAKHTRAGQRFKVIDPGPLPTLVPAPLSAGISIGQAVARMFGGFR